jgi:predicted aspartyl protease
VIRGAVTDDGTPIIILPVAGQEWTAVLDTGFNGDLQLPEHLRPLVNPRFLCPIVATLADGREVVEDSFEVDFPFDGQMVRAEATFVTEGDFLVGTNLLRDYVLQINFLDCAVHLQRVV